MEAALVAGLTGVGMESGRSGRGGAQLPARDVLAADPARLDQLPDPRTPQLHLALGRLVAGRAGSAHEHFRRQRARSAANCCGDRPRRAHGYSWRRGRGRPSSSRSSSWRSRRRSPHSGKVSRFEEDVFHAINDLPDFLRPIMYVFQLAGILFVPLIVAIGAAIYRKWWLTLCLVLVVPLKLFFEKKVIKKIVDRQRPGNEHLPRRSHVRALPRRPDPRRVVRLGTRHHHGRDRNTPVLLPRSHRTDHRHRASPS